MGTARGSEGKSGALHTTDTDIPLRKMPEGAFSLPLFLLQRQSAKFLHIAPTFLTREKPIRVNTYGKQGGDD